MIDHLDKIYGEKKESVERYKKLYSVKDLSEKIKTNKNYYDFEKPLNNKNKVNVIAEIKKASPSAGEIIKDYNPIEIAKKYAKSGATCLSVLTEEKNFKGKIEDIQDIKKEVKLPILCKDFIYDEYQLYLARAFGADAILIILNGVGQHRAVGLRMLAKVLGLAVIYEIHGTLEAEQTAGLEDVILGINNRNLETLETNIKNTFDVYNNVLSKKKHPGPIICESGIKSEKEVEEIVKKTKINNFLIGESLLQDLSKKTSLLERILKISP
jgi:indole-3-glycerol phosphate synthase